MKKARHLLPILLFALLLPLPTPVSAAESGRQSFINVKTEGDIYKNSFKILTPHVHEIEHAKMGPLKIIPAISSDHRIALFFADEDGRIVFKTDDFQSNTWLDGRVQQLNLDMSTIAFRDLNGNGLEDIVIITTCRKKTETDIGMTYNVADVLFQDAAGYYRDHRICDKLNRFDMNKSYATVIAFVRDGISMEFLFTAKTLSELKENGFQQNYSRSTPEIFERFGVVDVIPGYFEIAGKNYFMLYLVDQDGRILWNFQPMHDYVNYYAIKHISFADIDGDGNKDLTLLAWYVTHDERGAVVIKQDYNIYYQRAGYFWEDTEVKRHYPCTDEDDMDAIVARARRYWGFQVGE